MSLLANYQKEFSDIFNNFKQAVTILTVTRSSDNEGNITESTSSTITYAMIEYVTDSFTPEKFGELLNADAIAILSPSESISVGDEIAISSVNYDVKAITKTNVLGTVIYQECILTKSD